MKSYEDPKMEIVNLYGEVRTADGVADPGDNDVRWDQITTSNN